MEKAGTFTRIELLSAGLVIIVFLAILIPSLGHANQMKTSIVCLSNIQGLSKAYFLYHEDNDSNLPRPYAGSAGGNKIPEGIRYWVEVPQTEQGYSTAHDSTVAEKINGLRAGVIWPYAENEMLYHCLADMRYTMDILSRGKGAFRSYALPGGLNGWSSITLSSSVLGTSFKINSVRKYTELPSPSEKFILIEESYTHSPGTPPSLPINVGFNGGVWSFWRGRIYEAWWDPLAPWHGDMTNLGFADGHAKKRTWQDERTIWFASDRIDPRLGTGVLQCATQENNPDQEYISRIYPCIRQ